MADRVRGRWLALTLGVAAVVALVAPTAEAQTEEPVPTPDTAPPDTSAPDTTVPVDTTVPSTDPGTPVDPGVVVPTTTPDVPAIDTAELAGLRVLYDEAVAAEADALEDYRISVERQQAMEAQIAQTQVDLDAAEVSLSEAVVDSRQAASDHHVAQLTLAQRRGELVDEVARLRRIAVDAYIGGAGGDPVSEVILGQDDITTIDVINQYASVALGDQQSTINRIEELEIEIEEQQQVAARALEVAVDHRSQVAERRDELEAVKADLEAQSFLLSLEMAEQERLIADLRARVDEYSERLFALEADSDGVAAVLQSRQRGQVRGDRPVFSHPTPGQPLGSGFGQRIHPIFGGLRMHNGVDIGAPMGEPIRAAADGVVVMAELRQGFGNVVVIDHGGQFATVYAHQSGMNVRVGDAVVRGQIIGRVGSTGYSTGPHLHFEVRVLGEPVEPTGYMDLAAVPPCEVLLASSDPIDVALLRTRPECTDPATPLPLAEPNGG